MKFKKVWLFERSEFQTFLNFIIAQLSADFSIKLKNSDVDNIMMEGYRNDRP